MNFTAGEKQTFGTLAASGNGQALIRGRVLEGTPTVHPTPTRMLVTYGYVELVNASWCRLTEAGRATWEDIEQTDLFNACERDRQRQRRGR